MALRAIALNATLKSNGGKPSSTERVLNLIAETTAKDGVEMEIIRLADHDIKPGVTSDEGSGDAWPALRKKVLDGTYLFSARRSGLVSRPVLQNEFWNVWTLFSGKRIQRDGWPHTVGSRLWAWLNWPIAGNLTAGAAEPQWNIGSRTRLLLS